MAYVTKQDLIDRFGAAEMIQATDRTNRPPSTIDDVVLGRALADASSEIDGYVRKVARLPLTVVPAILVKRAADIARYYLHGKAAGKDDHVARAYAEALRWLRDVAAGLTMLDEGGEAPAPAADQAGRVSASEPVFTRRSLRGW